MQRQACILHVSARRQVRSHAAGSHDHASDHQFATITFVCGHPRHNAQGIIGHTSLNIMMLIKFMTSKRLPCSLSGNITGRGVHHAVKISNDSLGCLSHHTARSRKLIKTVAMSHACWCRRAEGSMATVTRGS
ncbi:TPA: hypothetical protein ACH3X1_011019 [Trebouxia sp. C0004]